LILTRCPVAGPVRLQISVLRKIIFPRSRVAVMYLKSFEALQ
jgi:hypothetical protein